MNEDREIRDTLRLFVAERFDDAHLDWQIEEVAQFGELRRAKFQARESGAIRWIIFRFYGLTSAVCYAWFELVDGALKPVMLHPEADIQKAVEMIGLPLQLDLPAGLVWALMWGVRLVFSLTFVITCLVFHLRLGWSWLSAVGLGLVASVMLAMIFHGFLVSRASQ